MPLTPAQRLQRLREGRARAAAAGGRIGGRAPYGFVSVHQDLIPHPDEAPVVWLICHLARRGWSQQHIADQLERLDIAPRAGQRWHPTTVRNVIIRGLPEEERRTAPRRQPPPADDQLELRAVT